MAALLELILLIGFVSAGLWSTSLTQDIVQLNQKIVKDSGRRAFLLQELQKDVAVLEEITNAFEQVYLLWGTELTQLSDDGNNNTSRNLSEECRQAIHDTLKGGDVFKKLLGMVDATGKIPAGLLEGNIYADGAYDECFSLSNTSYCTTFVNITSLPTPFPIGWKFGICVPRGCTGKDIATVVNTTVVLSSDESKSYCLDSKNPPYSAGSIVMITVCCLFAFLVILSSSLDCIITCKREGLDHFVGVHVTMPTDPATTQSRRSTETTPLLETATRSIAVKETHKRFLPLDFITAFSVFKNVPTILSTKQPPSAITCINGLRVISIGWVILGHTHLWLLDSTGVDNTIHAKELLSRFTFQAIVNAFYSVDSFFFLSGLLVAYLTLRHMARKKGHFPFIAYYVHRYLRLTPTYAFVIFFVWQVSMHLADGPSHPQVIWVGSALYENCAKYWWTNLLYISNLYPWEMKDECFGWTWYLANDMQFFLVAPLIIIPMYHFFPIGLGVATGFLVVCFVITATLTGVYDFQANLLAPFAYNYSTNVTILSIDVLYIKPWHRVSPYLVGLVLGYLLYRRAQLHFHRLANLFAYAMIWVLAAGIFMSTVYGLYPTWHGHTPSLFENILYNTFSRFAWGVGLALLVFACHNGYGWVINSFLSMKFWIPLSRLSFNAYLVHSMVISILYGSLRKSMHYGDINMAFYAVATTVISFGVAAVVTVFVEFPLGNVEQAIFKLVGLGGRESASEGTKGGDSQGWLVNVTSKPSNNGSIN